MPADCEIKDCGVLAVGRCNACGMAFCETHRARDHRANYVDLCSECRMRQQIATEQAAKDETAAIINRLRAIIDPFERLVTAMALLCTSGSGYTREKRLGSLAKAFPDVWDAKPSSSFAVDLTYAPPWNGLAIARWYAQRAINAGVRFDGEENWADGEMRRGLLGKHWVPPLEEPVWRFWGAGTQEIPAFIFADGRLKVNHTRVKGDSSDDPFSYALPTTVNLAINLRGTTLIQMAHRLGLT